MLSIVHSAQSLDELLMLTLMVKDLINAMGGF